MSFASRIAHHSSLLSCVLLVACSSGSSVAPIPGDDPLPPVPAPAPAPSGDDAGPRRAPVLDAMPPFAPDASDAAPAPAPQKSYDAAADFSAASNPNGAWKYGAKATRSSALVPYSTPRTDDLGLQVWELGGEKGVVYLNPTGVVQHPAGTITIEPGQLAMHPGSAGENAVIRWTAEVAGDYALEVRFTGISGYGGAPPTSTDVAVTRSGIELYAGAVNVAGSGNVATFATTLKGVAAGEVVDFTVGFGNGAHDFDSTAIAASITQR